MANSIYSTCADTKQTNAIKNHTALRIILFLLLMAGLFNSANAQITVSGTAGGAANGTYASLTGVGVGPNISGGVFATLNAGGSQAGQAITVSITASVTTEPGTNALNGEGWTSLTISPSGGAAITISGNVATPIIILNGATNVLIDGLNSGGNSLTIANSNTGSSAAAIKFIADASSNTIQNCTITSSSTSSVQAGTIWFSTGTTTGNINNNINHCNIGPTGANLPINAIWSLGTTGLPNSNTITANNIFDYFYAGGIATAGINLTSLGNNAWTITNNRLYQSATRIYTTAATHSGILISGGAGYTITGNTIGFATSGGTGTTNMVGNSVALSGTYPTSYTVAGTANATRYAAINCAFTAAGAASSIQNNTIAGFAFYSSSGASTINGVWCGIYIQSGNANIGTITGNTIGATSGQSSVYVANTVTGGTAVGIYATSANTVTIQNNTIGAIDAVGTTTALGGGVTGIDLAGAGNFTVTGNNIGNTTASNIRTGYTATAGILSNTGTLASTTGATGALVGIRSAATGNTLAINTNTLQNWTESGTVTAVTGITSSGVMTGTTPSATINGNFLGTATSGAGAWINYTVACSGALFGIALTNTVATTHSIQNNNYEGIVHTVAGTSAHTYINLTGATAAGNTATIAGNTFTNLNVNTTGAVTFITHNYVVSATGVQTINNNSIVTGFTKGGGTATVTVMTSAGASAAGAVINHTNNNFSNITITGSTAASILGIANTDGSTNSTLKTCTGNTFNNWTTGAATITAISYSSVGSTSTISNNTITNLNGQSIITGINIAATGNLASPLTVASNNITSLISTGTGGAVTGIVSSNTSPAINITGNTVSTLSSTGASSTVVGISITGGYNVNVNGNNINTISGSGATSPVANGISVSAGTLVNIYQNKICSISESGTISTTSPCINGIVLSSTTASVSATVYNNLIGGLTAPAASLTDAIRGISVTATGATSPYNVYYNTIYLAASSSGANFGTTGIFHTTSATATTAALTLRNNIVVNNSTPHGTGLVVAYRRSSSTLTNYVSISNNNLFYAGAPTVSNLIYSDGTNSDQLLSAYQTLVASRDNLSVTENPNFLSTTCGASNFLSINPAIATQVESGAVNISGITNDYYGNIRQGNAGYPVQVNGGGTAPDIGADEVDAIPSATVCSGTPAPGNTLSSVATACVGVNFTLYLQNATTGYGVTYQWQSSPNNSTWTNISGATSASYTGNQSVATYYRCNVTCSSNTGTSTALLVNSQSASGNCYCTPPTSSNACLDMWIANVTFGTINNTSGCAAASFTDFTSLSTNAIEGAGLPISMTDGSAVSGSYYPMTYSVWIDLNNDGVFTPNELLLQTAASSAALQTVTGNIIIPIGTSGGLHRMRVRGDYYGDGLITNPCTTVTYGETEDYTVNVIPGNYVDASVLNVYSLGQLPLNFGAPHVVTALVTNAGNTALTSLPVTLNITGANTFTNTQTVSSLAIGASTVVTFAGFTAVSLGNDTIKVSVPNDSNNTNNLQLWNQVVTTNVYSYKNPAVADAGGVGFTGATGDFVAKFTTAISNVINEVQVDFASGGQPYEIGIWDNTGAGGTPGVNLYTSGSLTSATGTAFISIPNVSVAGSFYVGVRQTGTTNVNFGYQTESPIRASTFYYTSPDGGTAWTDFAPANPFRFSIAVQLFVPQPPNCAGNISPVNGTQGVCFTPTLSWASGGGGPTGYNVYLSANYSNVATQNALALVSANQAGTTYSPATLSANTTYYWWPVPINNVGPATGCSVDSFTTGSIAVCYCTTPLYSVGSGCSIDLYINNFQFAGISNLNSGCTAAPFYTYYNQTGTAAQGLTYPVTISAPPYTTVNYNQYFNVFIDFNDNGSFDDAGEQVYASADIGTIVNSVTATITIPAGANLGTHRLRVRSANAASVNSCSIDGVSGEVEDYSITITAPPPSIIYNALNFTCSTGDDSLTNVSITTSNGVPTSGSLMPRIYYKKNSGSWFSQPGILTGGTANAGTWSFPIFAADMSGVVLGDKVSYYVIAQDVTGLIASNAFGAIASDVNTVTTPPASPLYYSISPPFVVVAPVTSTICAGNSVVLTASSGNTTLSSNYCTSGLYSIGCTDNDYISNVTFSYINRSSTCDDPTSGGYSIYSSPNPILIPGYSYILSITTTASFTEGGAAWIDYNQNGSFADGGETVLTPAYTGVAGAIYTATVTIPLNATPGLTLLRTRCTYAAAPPDACTLESFGEVEDYYVTIAGLIASNYTWSPSTGLSSTSGSIVTASPPATQTYTITATDNNGCPNTATATVSVNLPPSATTSNISNVSCNGGSNGSIIASVTSGTGPFTYLWSNGGTTNPLSGIAAGTYAVTVTAANGCTTSVTNIGVNQPASPLAANPTVANISCNGSSNGSISLNPSGGTSGYAYAWSNGQTTSALANLGINIYSVTVTDSHGCTVVSTTTLTQPAVLAAGNSVTGSVSCNGGSNGSVSVSASGGSSPYNGTGAFTGLSAGTYTYIVTDSHGCTANTSLTLTQPSAITASASASANVSCNGGSNGTALVTASGGTAPYSGTGSFTGLSSGSYTYIVTDSKGCTASAGITITQPSVISVSAGSNTPVCIGANINLTSSASGGTGTLMYSWSGPLSYSATGANPSAITNASALNSGSYSLTVTDANSCSVTTATTVTVISCSTILNLKMFTQGYYIGSGQMIDVLFQEGVCPTCFTQVDTFIVEVHNTTSPYGVVESVQIILNTDGTGTAVFSAGVAGHSYYIGIRHRNTVQTWSRLPYAFATTGNFYDFSTDVTKAYSISSLSPMIQVDTSPIVWAFYTGDINQDENIDLIDFPPLDFGINNGLFGYYAMDLNGDGNVDLLDFPLLDGNINAGVFAQFP